MSRQEDLELQTLLLEGRFSGNIETCSTGYLGLSRLTLHE